MGINLGIKWRYNGFPSLQYWQNHRFTKGMKPSSRTTQWHLLLRINCYSAAFLVSKVNLTNPLLCPLFLVVPKNWERRNNVGLRNLGHRLSLKCRMGSDKRHEGKNMPQTYQWWTALVHMWVASKHLWARTKVCLQQMDTVRRTLSQAVAETTALKKQ